MCCCSHDHAPAVKLKKVDILRKYGTLSLISIVILVVLGVIVAFQERWAASIVLGFLSLACTSVLVLVCARYISRLLRTQERKTRRANKQLAEASTARFDTVMEFINASFSAQQRKIEELEQAMRVSAEMFSELEAKIQKTARSNANHVSQTARHSTNEIEALLQIYSRFTDTKLPMPSTGGWALDARSLAHLIALFEEKRPQRILEIGSGTSTIWLAYLCQSFGGKVVTLDHLEKYLNQTRAAIRAHGLENYVDARLAPLEETWCGEASYKWYSQKALADLSNVDMVLIDGPPASTGRKARYPALPMVIERLAKDATVILDDAHRPDETDTLTQWQSEFPDFERLVLDTPRLAVLHRNAAEGSA